MSQRLVTLAIPPCPFCKNELSFSAVGFQCEHCQAWQDAKTASAAANRERMEASGWKEVDVLKEIIEESKT